MWAARLGLLVTLAALVAGLYLAQASQMSTTGRRLEAMREQYDELKRENAELLYLVSQDSGVVTMRRRAAEQGFVPAEKIVHLPLTSLPIPK